MLWMSKTCCNYGMQHKVPNNNTITSTRVIWSKAESLLISSFLFARWQQQFAICNCIFWLRGSTPKSPLPLAVRDPIQHNMSLDPEGVPAKWHLNPSSGLSRVHECDRWQTDHAMEKCVVIGGITIVQPIPCNNIVLMQPSTEKWYRPLSTTVNYCYKQTLYNFRARTQLK